MAAVVWICFIVGLVRIITCPVRIYRKFKKGGFDFGRLRGSYDSSGGFRAGTPASGNYYNDSGRGIDRRYTADTTARGTDGRFDGDPGRTTSGNNSDNNGQFGIVDLYDNNDNCTDRTT